MKFYERQGITVAVGAKRFTGNIPDMVEYGNQSKGGGNHRGQFIFLSEKHAKTQGKKTINGKDVPIFLINIFNEITLGVADPNVVQDMFTTKMTSIDKDYMFG
jgi:hypothetical protein